MEQGGKNKKYKCDEIPVIFFNFESDLWEAWNKETAQSRIAAKYKNQMDAGEARKASGSSALRGSRSARSERFDEDSKKRKGGMFSKGFARILLLMVLLYLIWMWINAR